MTDLDAARPTTRLGGVVEPAAVAATAAFAGAALLSQTVIVPGWRAMTPAEFARQFAVQGPATGATVFPFEAVALVLLCVVTYSAIRSRRPGRTAWALATVAMLGTFVLLATYFVRADLTLLDPAFPARDLPGELAAWSRWNWLRAALGLVAAACAATGLVLRRRG